MSQLLEVTVAQSSPSASLGTARTHRMVVDRPQAKGGTDQGATGGEHFLVGLGGCFMSNLLAAAAARGVEADDFVATVAGTVDGSPARFQAIEVRVSGGCDPETLRKLVAIAERGCVVANTLGAALELRVTLD